MTSEHVSASPEQAITLPLSIRLLQRLEFPHKLGICERLFGKRLARFGVCWAPTAAGLNWKLDLENSTLRWIVYGKYEGSHFLKWAKDFLPPDGVVVDSGANIGQMVLYLSQYVPDGQVFAFEPGVHQADWLEECLAVHRHLPVRLERSALGDSDGTAFLRSCGPEHSHGSWNQVADEGQAIRMVRLSHFLSDNSVERVDLWKLDVEGYEVVALKGAEEWLGSHRIRALWIETVGENGERIRRFLEPLGYRPFLFETCGKPKAAALLPEHGNALFLPQ